jgi:D-galactarolactone cycloisomerase
MPPSLIPMPPMLEFEQTENPFRDHLAVEPITHNGGIVSVPDKPGLGIAINRAIIDRYSVK